MTQPAPASGPPQPLPPPVPMPMRLSPKVLLIDPVRMLPSLLLPLVGVLFVGGFSPRSFLWAAIGIGGTIIFAVVRWATFTYQIVGDRLELKRSLISRSVRTIPLERIRGVDVTTPPMHRLLGLAVLKLDTGASGGAEQEGELDGLEVAEGERLKAVLLRRAHVPVHEDQPHARPQPDNVIIRVPRAWLLYGPLSGAYLLTLFALAGGAIGLAFQWGGELGFRDEAWDLGQSLLDHPIFIAAAVLMLVILMPFVGGVMYAVFHWDFTLTRRDGYLVAERGLINRRSVSLEARRVRGYEIADGLAERWAGVARAWAIVTGLGDSETRGQLLPDVPRKVAESVTSAAIGPYTAGLRPHPPIARNRRLFRAIAPNLALAALFTPAAVSWSPVWWVLAGVAMAAAVAGIPSGWTGTGRWGTDTTGSASPYGLGLCVAPRRSWSGARWWGGASRRRGSSGALA